MRVAMSTLSAAAVVMSSAVGAKEPPVARATSGWQVDFGDQRCLAMRQYDVAGQVVMFAIDPDPNGLGARLTFRIDDSREKVGLGWRKAQLTVGRCELDDRVSVIPGLARGALILGGYRIKHGEAQPLSGAQPLTLRSTALTANLPLGPIDRINALLAECNAGLLDSWGFSRAEQARIGTMPEGEVRPGTGSWDYPPDAARDRLSGEVSVRYWVDAQGKASDCQLRRSSGVASLDRATCRFVNERVRFTPAKDKAGRPMAVIDTARVRWVAPEH